MVISNQGATLALDNPKDIKRRNIDNKTLAIKTAAGIYMAYITILPTISNAGCFIPIKSALILQIGILPKKVVIPFCFLPRRKHSLNQSAMDPRTVSVGVQCDVCS